MRNRLKQFVLVIFVIFAAAQLVRPKRTNPDTDPNSTLSAQMGTQTALATILNRSCDDCHSNNTAWPWYTNVAPISWIMAWAVTEGRAIVNFSEWGNYSPEQRRSLLVSSCKAAREGTMPGIYSKFRPKTRLSVEDIQTICSAAEERNDEPRSQSP